MEAHEGRDLLPFEFLEDFLEAASKAAWLHFLRYSDLNWRGDFDPESMYRSEWMAWKRSSGLHGHERASVLLQIDVDSEPERAMLAVALAARFSIPINVMIFSERIDREKLRDMGLVVPTEYPIDDDLLKRMENRGLVEVGYHCNAVERSRYDLEVALAIFEQDVNRLRTRYPKLDSFSAHGGVPGPDSMNNYRIPIGHDQQSRLGLRWVHNGRTPRFMREYSDGGLLTRTAGIDQLSLYSFVSSFCKGHRYRILLHPQYFAPPTTPVQLGSVPRQILERPWYQSILRRYRPDEYQTLPRDVRLPEKKLGRVDWFELLTNEPRSHSFGVAQGLFLRAYPGLRRRLRSGRIR